MNITISPRTAIFSLALRISAQATLIRLPAIHLILPDDRRRHVAILGKTGMGKSTLLHNLIASDIKAGRGVCLIDPHDDLSETVLHSVPKHRTNDVVLFDAGAASYPLSFNVLSCQNAEQRPLVASGIVGSFKKAYSESWGPRLEHILRNALLALLETPDSSLVTSLRLLTESRFRAAVAAKVTDPAVRAFWQREFAGMPPKLQAEAIGPIQNKVGHIVSSPVLRNILGQSHSTLDLRRVMDEGKVLIVNLSKGRIGEDASALLGSLLVSCILRHEWPLHRTFHTYVGASVIGVVVGFVAFAVSELLIKWWQRGEASPMGSGTAKPRSFRRNAALLGGMIGGISHVLLDSIMHQDIQPVWPFTKVNDMLGAINLVGLHRGCVIAGLAGLAIMFVNRIPRTTG